MVACANEETTPIGADGDPSASLDLALSTARHFGVTSAAARSIVARVGRAVGRWRTAAAALKVKRGELDALATAFEHEDAVIAR